MPCKVTLVGTVKSYVFDFLKALNISNEVGYGHKVESNNWAAKPPQV